jgi:hypothetical protein
MQRFEAQVIDANHLKLLQPIQMPPRSNVVVTIFSSEETANEDRFWFQLSQQGLAAAYDSDEPDYPTELIKHPNPEFQS